MREIPRFERADIRTRHVVVTIDEAAEEQADVIGPQQDTLAGIVWFGNCPAAFLDQPRNESGDCIRKRGIHGLLRELVLVGFRHRQSDDGRLLLIFLSEWRQWNITCL